MMRSLWLKRLLDVLASATGLLLLLPLLLLIALWVKFDSPGSIFFRQERIGLRGNLGRNGQAGQGRGSHGHSVAACAAQTRNRRPQVAGRSLRLRRLALSCGPMGMLMRTLRGGIGCMNQRV